MDVEFRRIVSKSGRSRDVTVLEPWADSAIAETGLRVIRERPRRLPYVRNVNLEIVLEPSDEGGYTVYVPTLPGCISEGNTREEALDNIREAIELYLEPVEDDLAGKEDADIAELTV